MGDLISRSVLKKAFSKNSIFEKITDARGMNVLEIIDEQPNAYDVDAVVKELEELCVTDIDVLQEMTIDIVKAGGVG